MNDTSESTPSESTPGEFMPGGPTPGRSHRSFVGAAVLAILGLLATAGVKSYSDLDVAREQERELLEEIAAAKKRIRLLNERIERIENDPAMLERIAREELGMVREGDVVIVLPEEAEPPVPTSPQLASP